MERALLVVVVLVSALAVAVDRAPPGRNTGAVVALVVLLQLLVGQDSVLDHLGILAGGRVLGPVIRHHAGDQWGV